MAATSLLSGCMAEAVDAAVPVKPQAVKLITLGEDSGFQQRVIPAEVDANHKSELSFRISGQLVALDVTEGQRVHQGQLVAKLDDRDLSNTLKAANADRRLAQVQFERIERLYRAKQVSSSDYDTAKAQLDSAAAAQRIAEDQLGYTNLYAPFDGIIATRPVNNHQVVMANQAIMRIQSEAELEVTVEVPASMMMGMQAERPFAQYRPQVRFGDALYPIVYKKHASQVTAGTQTYKVTFLLDRPELLNLLPGMAAEVVFQQAGQANAQLIPLTALAHRDLGNQTVVWRYHRDNQQLEPVPVEVLAVQQQGLAVRGDLARGDEIVAAGATFLRADMKVVPLKWERGV